MYRFPVIRPTADPSRLPWEGQRGRMAGSSEDLWTSPRVARPGQEMLCSALATPFPLVRACHPLLDTDAQQS